jgi:Ca-activated chloride channel family protein
MRAMRSLGAPTLVVAVTAAVAGAGQSPRQPVSTFKSGSAAVPIFATVSDADHRLLPSLTAADFQVFDDGEAQEVTVFDRSAVPISVVILLDASESMRATVPLLRAAAAEFVERLHGEDQAELGTFNHVIRFARPFTSDHARLLETLRYFGAVDFGTGLWEAINESFNELQGKTGRKVVLVFTDGESNVGRVTPNHITERARAEEVMVYSVTLETVFTYRGQVSHSKADPRLATLSAETGAGSFPLKESADLKATFIRVAEELHSQYTLGFEPQHLDGRIHQLEVRVRQDGARVVARRSYLAARKRD